ncbi:hypothetical protein EGM88_10060 [Aureibaculum marinum]|uniref:Lipoprotein n=1 Tax=Aureibaculum marinum TaxID=2487930 RepID=A0A3N4NK41_9FLAO|nr:hypothetical protein [Aureibaculum marinum]RPD96694.1 hypothetical protein EGM88_10060 [Aureibaculum marinum]
MYRFSFLCIAFLFILQGCIKQHSKKETLIRKEYGQKIVDNDSTYVAINIDNYPTYSKLDNRMQELACNDSTPKISFKSDTILKTVYFYQFCYTSGIIYCPRLKNIIEVTKDSVFKVTDNFPIIVCTIS